MREIYHDLEIWQRANSLCLKVFRLSNALPLRERLSLFSKIRNSSELIPLKIAYCSSSPYINEYIDGLKESYRLLVKLKTEILISRHLQYISTFDLKAVDVDVNDLIQMVLKMINNLEIKKHALNPSFAYWFPPFKVN